VIHNKGIKLVSTSIYINPPSWLEIPNYDEDYLVLDKDVTREEVDLFLLGLFIYNYIPFTEDSEASIQNLLKALTDGIVLGGGLMFFEGDKKILPSCCCGLEQWQEAIEDISQKIGVWLGHDPMPIIEYQEHSILVLSDDYNKPSCPVKSKSDLVCIEFSTTELECFLAQIKDDIKDFFEIPFRKRLNEIDSNNSDRVVSAVMAEFDVFYEYDKNFKSLSNISIPLD